MSDHDEDQEDSCECEHPHGRLTVRDFISLLMDIAPDLDAELVVSLSNGPHDIALELVGVADLGTDDDPTVLILTDFPTAWNSATGENMGAGVLLLDGNPIDEDEDE